MKKNLFFMLLIGSFVLGSEAIAEYKIAYVDATKVFEESPQYEAARKALENEFTRRDAELVSKQKQLTRLEDKLERDGAVMSSSELNRLERDILSERRKLKNLTEEFREDFNLRRNEEFNKLRRQVAEVVREVGKQENIDMILTDGVVYFSKRVDISDKVLQLLKRKYRR